LTDARGLTIFRARGFLGFEFETALRFEGTPFDFLLTTSQIIIVYLNHFLDVSIPRFFFLEAASIVVGPGELTDFWAPDFLAFADRFVRPFSDGEVARVRFLIAHIPQAQFGELTRSVNVEQPSAASGCKCDAAEFRSDLAVHLRLIIFAYVVRHSPSFADLWIAASLSPCEGAFVCWGDIAYAASRLAADPLLQDAKFEGATPGEALTAFAYSPSLTVAGPPELTLRADFYARALKKRRTAPAVFFGYVIGIGKTAIGVRDSAALRGAVEDVPDGRLEEAAVLEFAELLVEYRDWDILAVFLERCYQRDREGALAFLRRAAPVEARLAFAVRNLEECADLLVEVACECATPEAKERFLQFAFGQKREAAITILWNADLRELTNELRQQNREKADAA
jgi:hypothetical protein